MSSWLTPDMVERHQHKSLMALPAIEAYVDSHGGFSVDEDQQGSHGNTNYVAFGHKDSQPAVFKYFLTRSDESVRSMVSGTGRLPSLYLRSCTMTVVTCWCSPDSCWILISQERHTTR